MESLSHQGTRQNYYAFSDSYCIAFIIQYLVFFYFSFSFLHPFLAFLWPVPPLFLITLNTLHAPEDRFSLFNSNLSPKYSNFQGSCRAYCVWEYAYRSIITLFEVFSSCFIPNFTPYDIFSALVLIQNKKYICLLLPQFLRTSLYFYE